VNWLTFVNRQRLQREFAKIDWRGELVATVGCFAGISLVRLISSVTLTRILYPEAYGIVVMMSMAAYVLEMVSDIGATALLVRHARGRDPAFLHTVWSVRFLKGLLNAAILFFAAPWIANWYQTPLLELSLRIFSLTFLIKAVESMTFLLAMRDQRSRVISYAELISACISTTFVIVYSYFSRDHYGMIFGMILNTLCVVSISYIRTDRVWPKFMLEKDAVKEIFGFAKYVTPSSIVTIFVSQFDKIIFLKLFDLRLMGLYGVANGIAGPVESLGTRINHMVLYPRCAKYFREDPDNVANRYYKENYKLLALIIALPAIVAGLASPIIQLLFDARYAGAAVVIQAFCLRGVLLAFAGPSENLLVAAGNPKMVLIGNLLRLLWLVPASLIGFHYWGFHGFVFAAAFDVAPLVAFLWYQRSLGKLINFRNEMIMICYAISVFSVCWLIGLKMSGVIELIKTSLRIYMSGH